MRGGPRKGAGRKKGSLNRKGIPTAKTKAEVREAVAASGETPMDYMLRVMRDPTITHERRDRMAGQVAPYVHAKLANVQVTGKDGGPIEYTDARDKLAHLLDRQSAASVADPNSRTTH